MPSYVALIYSEDIDWSHPDHAATMGETMGDYAAFAAAAAAVIRGGSALYPTSSATTVRVSGRGGEVMLTDGPYAETKEALTGFYLLECADIDEALRWAAQIPSAWTGAVEVRPLMPTA